MNAFKKTWCEFFGTFQTTKMGDVLIELRQKKKITDRFIDLGARLVCASVFIKYTSWNACITDSINAINKLLKGPAAATKAVSRRGWRKLRGSTGTGFAQPNTKPVKVKNNNGIITRKIGNLSLIPGKVLWGFPWVSLNFFKLLTLCFMVSSVYPDILNWMSFGKTNCINIVME